MASGFKTNVRGCVFKEGEPVHIEGRWCDNPRCVAPSHVPGGPNLIRLIEDQREFSRNTFGPVYHHKRIINHIRKELEEIEADPGDLSEWIDVVILALDGAWRSGHTPDEVVAQLIFSMARNRNRKWPDWQQRSEDDEPMEHVR
jgi:hypothetical protein